MGIPPSRRKSKGSAAERELIHLFWDAGWTAHRIAGSGSSQRPSPDLIAGRSGRVLAIEVKATNDEKKYFPRLEIDELNEYATKTGVEAWVAVKFLRTPWWFLRTKELEQTPSSYVLTKKLCEEKGCPFERLAAIF
ncbi:MAG: Holliday junction resolvase Hjc [Nanoarchaeota archaeon]